MKLSTPLDLIRLTPLMERTRGRPELKIGLIDGPVAIDHPELVGEHISEIGGATSGSCMLANSAACLHGTFIAGLLSAKRSSPAPAICPDCTLLIRPIFAETTSESSQIPSATPQELAEAIFDCVKWGVQIINLSAALVQSSRTGERELGEAITYAADRGVMIVAAGGNQGVIGSTVITRHPWVIPVAACDLRGKPLDYSNLGNSISRHGLSAPGEDITSLGANGRLSTFSGTSAAAPFVTGAIALLWSEFPGAKSAEVKHAVTQSSVQRRATVVPPLLDAWEAHEVLKSKFRRRM